MTRVSQAVVVVATLMVGCGLPQAVAAEADTTKAETEAIARWVAELGAPQFARREAASKAVNARPPAASAASSSASPSVTRGNNRRTP